MENMIKKEQENLLEAGFTQDQIREIQEGEKAGIDTSLYARREFFAIQMRQIRLGLMEHLPVEEYAKLDYDWFQMEEIRKGLQAGVDISQYAFPNVTYDKMRQVRKGLLAGINLAAYVQLDAGLLRELRRALVSRVNILEYIKGGYETEQLEQIRIALERGVDIKPYLHKEFRGASIQEICQGLERGLDVSIYAKIEFGWQQMREIRLGLANRVDVHQYAKPLYAWQQMREIRLGLESGLDVSSYRSLMYTARDMEKKRTALLKQREEEYFESDSIIEGLLLAGIELDDGKGFSISVSSDELEVYIDINENTETLKKEDILRALKLRGIRKGILEQAIDRLLEKRQERKEPVLIAKGVKAIHGEDGWYEYFFRTEIDSAPLLLPDGSVDYQNIEWFEMVEQGQKIAFYHEAGAGVDGYTVTGKILHGENGKELSALTGKGFMLMPDQKTYLSTVAGRVELKEGRLEVSKMLEVEEVTLATGNVQFDGSVHVKGNVGSGTVIHATEDVFVDGNVESAVIECGGSVVLRQGANAAGNGWIKAGKNANGRFFEAIRVYAGEEIRANYCLNCELYAEKKIVVSGTKGTLAGGTAYAGRGLQAYNVGNWAGLVTYLKLGIDEGMTKQKQEIEDQIKEAQEELSILGNAYLDFQKKYPPAVRNTMEMYLKIESAIYTKEKEISELSETYNQMEAKLKTMGDDKAVIKGSLYEGTIVEINGQKWSARSIQDVTLKNVRGRIRVRAN